MANLRSSKKDAIRSAKNRLVNRAARHNIKVLRKQVYTLAIEKKTELAEEKFKKFVSVSAKACKKNIIKPNKLSRTVSRLHHKIKEMGCFA
jgi:ribosomal protein S20